MDAASIEHSASSHGRLLSSARVASGGPGKLKLEDMMREVRTPPPLITPTHAHHPPPQLLDELLANARWAHLAPHLDPAARDDLTLAWHRLPGWADSSAGLYAIKKHALIATLSNGSTRALADMVRVPPSPRSGSGSARG